ncbi:lytic murein transglycosylase B [Marinagarivorans algicola]|uniref:lytic murein transglycosylase B n=1 Tax=Marinagarivorans algicola TaxID=1513270 RepID=UPI0006B41205
MLIGSAVWAESTPMKKGYETHKNAQAFIDTMVNKHGFEREYVVGLLKKAEKKPSILAAIARPAEKTKPWHEYRNIFLKEKRIQDGVDFWLAHQDILAAVQKETGIPANIIVAIIGVETRYGQYMGSYRVLDALTTLGFDYPKRGAFFTRQLEAFLLLTREQHQDPLTLKGSYAGAMGYGQFIPSSYRSFAVDFDGDGFADIWNNKKDAIASVANYFKAHGWQNGEPVAERASKAAQFPRQLLNIGSRPKTPANELATLGFAPLSRQPVSLKPAMALEFTGVNGPEYWLGYNNFYVITRYNRNKMYALAVYQLSEEISSAKRAAEAAVAAQPKRQ